MTGGVQREVRVFLTGFMGSGKTTVGRRLADTLEMPFLDLDDEVERTAGSSIREIFATAGEGAFRELETRALAAAAEHPDVVVATGGGTPTFARNMELMHRAGVSVWLNPPFATIVQRIGGLGKQDRPLFRDESQALHLYRDRVPAYRRADLQVDVAPDEEPGEVASRISLLLRGL